MAPDDLDSPAALDAALAAEPDSLLLQVLPPEVFAAAHLPGALEACVYETRFLEQVAELAAPSRPIIVYGAGEGSQDAASAAAKLRAAGHSPVRVFSPGLAGWRAAGRALDGHGRLPEPPPPHGRYAIDPASSLLRWTGRNLFNHHHGILRAAAGEAFLQHGALDRAWLEIDMNSLRCDDLEDSALNQALVRHLRDADFFEIDRFPRARFDASGAEPLPDAAPGRPTHRLAGEATIRGHARPLVIDASVAIADEGGITLQAQFELDRTEFGSRYGSSRFFHFLGKHVVDDCIHLHAILHASPLPE